jgi:hypothetical protein
MRGGVRLKQGEREREHRSAESRLQLFYNPGAWTSHKLASRLSWMVVFTCCCSVALMGES